MSTPYQKAYFLLSAADCKQLPSDQGVEVAIVGRSNAGKSSVLNCITRQKGLARVSKTPGRTQLINIFVVNDKSRLIDLPGYGYAKVPLAAKMKWQKLIDTYLHKRKSLRGMVLVMDIRHPLQELDLHLLAYCEARDIPVHILLNKADKFSKGAAIAILHKVKAELAIYQNAVSVQVFSALKKTGLDALYSVLDTWFAE